MIKYIIDEFAAGVEGEPVPDTACVELAGSLLTLIDVHSKSHELSVDIDGAISFVVITESHKLISGELSVNGKLYAWLYPAVNSTVLLDQITDGTDIKKFRQWLGGS